MRKGLVLGGLTVLLLVALAPPASATTWSGRCEYRGFIKLYPPRTVMPVPSGYLLTAVGHCRGVLDGKPFDGPTSFYANADMKSPMGCIIGASFRGAPAHMRFARGELDALRKPEPAATSKKSKKKSRKKKRKPPPRDPTDVQMDVVVDEMNINVVLPVHIEGVFRGHAVGTARFVIPNDELPERMRQCGAEGIDGLPMDFEFDTLQELYG